MAKAIIQQQVDYLEAFRKSLIGVPMAFVAKEVPDAFMICDGSLVLFEDWPEFKDAYDSGKFTGMVLDSADSAQVGKFVLNGSAGVYLPDLTGLYEQASTAANAGIYLAAGLPIPSGALQGVITDGGSATGVFTYQQTSAMNLTVGGGAKQAGTFSTHASGIYGTSTTVQPPSVQYVRAMYLGKPNVAAA